jgi:hypothetical protein
MTGRDGADTFTRMDNTESFRRQVWGALTVGVVTAGWLGVMALLAWRYFTIALLADEADHRLGRLGLLAVAALVGGPTVIAGIAWSLRLGAVARAYLVIALVLALPAAYGVWVSWRGLHPPAPAPSTPPAPPTHCVAYSGGSNNCPGG